MRPHSPLAHRELVIVLLLTLVGAGLRFSSFGKLGLTHFDEGIYALWGLWAVQPAGWGAIDPTALYYAPPGYPILVGLAYMMFGVTDSSAILVSLVCGVLTIPVTAWLGRRTFGAGAGAASAALATLSLAHVAFSRKALTDAPFLLVWLLAIGFGQRFLEKPRLGRALAMGLAVGLAQLFKYNGWLTGTIVVIAAVLGVPALRREHRIGTLLRTFGWGLLAAHIAALVYWPWYQFVERRVGYAALLSHHRGYLGGLEDWLPHWRQQLAQSLALSGGLYWGMLMWVTAWLGATIAANGKGLVGPNDRWNWVRFRVGLLGGATALAATSNLPWWVGLASLPWLLCDAGASVRVVGVWWLVLSILTPFYHPYARLWLPLDAVGWLLVGGAIVQLGPFPRPVLEPSRGPLLPTRRSRRGMMAWELALALCLGLGHLQDYESGARAFPVGMMFEATNGLRLAISDLFAPPPIMRGSGIRVLARRPASFYLLLFGSVPVSLESGIEQFREPGAPDVWALIDETLLIQDERTNRNVHSLSVFRRRSWTRMIEWQEELDPVTLLDVAPDTVFEAKTERRVSLWLFAPRVSSTAGTALPAMPPVFPRPPQAR